jgi:hypothetical protein
MTGKSNYISANDRWEQGIPHDQRSLELCHFIDQLDWDECGGCLDLRFGGDDDSGKNLMFLMDIYFELKDKGLPLITGKRIR